MAKKIFSNVKLGVFVITGLFFLILALYIIGKNKNLFGSSFIVKTHFLNVQGLVPGNNVRYAGIQVGTVNKIVILNNGQIEVEMLIEKKMKQHIRNNAAVSIATDGLMGNKVINIVPVEGESELIAPGDTLMAEDLPGLDAMINTFSCTNNDLAVVVAELKKLMLRINDSPLLLSLLRDSSLSGELSASLANVRLATAGANNMMNKLNGILLDIEEGKGSLGAILRDTVFVGNLNEALVQIKHVAGQADNLADELSRLTSGLKQDVDSGRGTVHALLKDPEMVKTINASLENIEKSTQNFNEVMEGLKHSFLVRGYFRKFEKKKQKEAKDNQKID